MASLSRAQSCPEQKLCYFGRVCFPLVRPPYLLATTQGKIVCSWIHLASFTVLVTSRVLSTDLRTWKICGSLFWRIFWKNQVFGQNASLTSRILNLLFMSSVCNRWLQLHTLPLPIFRKHGNSSMSPMLNGSWKIDSSNHCSQPTDTQIFTGIGFGRSDRQDSIICLSATSVWRWEKGCQLCLKFHAKHFTNPIEVEFLPFNSNTSMRLWVVARNVVAIWMYQEFPMSALMGLVLKF